MRILFYFRCVDFLSLITYIFLTFSHFSTPLLFFPSLSPLLSLFLSLSLYSLLPLFHSLHLPSPFSFSFSSVNILQSLPRHIVSNSTLPSLKHRLTLNILYVPVFIFLWGTRPWSGIGPGPRSGISFLCVLTISAAATYNRNNTNKINCNHSNNNNINNNDNNNEKKNINMNTIALCVKLK